MRRSPVVITGGSIKSKKKRLSRAGLVGVDSWFWGGDQRGRQKNGGGLLLLRVTGEKRGGINRNGRGEQTHGNTKGHE